MWLHVTDQGGNAITTFAIEGTGAIASPTDTPVPTGFQPFALCADPSGSMLFVTGVASNQLLGMAAQQGTLIPGTRIATSSATPVAVVADGTHVYVANENVSSSGAVAGPGSIQEFAYSGNSITAAGTAVAVGVIGGPTACVLDPARSFLYVALGADNEIVSIPVIGNLLGSPGQGVTAANPSGSTPPAMPGPIALAINPAGTALFCGNSNGTITAFALHGGVPTPVGAPVLASTSLRASPTPISLAVDPTGTFLASANNGAMPQIEGSSGTDDVSVFLIAANATISALGDPQYAAGSAPGSVVFHPSLMVVYTANTGNNTVSCFSVSTTAGLTVLASAQALPAGDTFPSALAISR